MLGPTSKKRIFVRERQEKNSISFFFMCGDGFDFSVFCIYGEFIVLCVVRKVNEFVNKGENGELLCCVMKCLMMLLKCWIWCYEMLKIEAFFGNVFGYWFMLYQWKTCRKWRFNGCIGR